MCQNNFLEEVLHLLFIYGILSDARVRMRKCFREVNQVAEY